MRIKLALAFVLTLICAQVHAQVPKSTLNTNTATSFPDNSTGAITPQILRSYFGTMISSFQQYAGVRNVTITSDTIGLSDYGQLINYNSASPVAISLPAANGAFSPFNFYSLNTGTGSITITPQGGSLINGVASLTIVSGTSAWIISDGTNWQVWGDPTNPGIPANVLNIQTSNYTIAATDCGKTILAGTGSTGFFTVTVPSVAGFPSTCVVAVVNGDISVFRGKGIGSFTGCSTQQILWPAQACTIGIVNGAWTALSRPGRWRPPAGTLNFYSDFTNGSDMIGAADGLASGASAFKSAERCFLNVEDQIDYGSAQQTTIQCNMAANTVDTQGMHSPVHSLVGAQGGAAFQVVGASLAISGAVTNGGLCKITVPATASYSLNQVVSVYGVGGATGCNGAWKVTVTDGTHLTLQGTTFGGLYTSGGTVTNGSSFNVTGNAAVSAYFGTVMQFQNVTFGSDSAGIGTNIESKVYLNSGNIFTGTPAAGHINVFHGGSQIHANGDIGIASGAISSLIFNQYQGLFLADTPISVNFVPGINPNFGLATAYADNQAQVNFNNITINLNGNTVTGPRFKSLSGARMMTGAGTASPTYFPGNVAGTVGQGATYDTILGSTPPTTCAGYPGAVCPAAGASGTYTTPNFVTSVEVFTCAGGGGGIGSGTTPGAAGAGTSSTFGTVTANGGAAGAASGAPSAGGTATGGDDNIAGGSGGPGGSNLAQGPGGAGGVGPRGGNGPSPSGGLAGVAAAASTCAGGSGGAVAATNPNGGGGAAGGWARKIFYPTLGQTFSFTVGSKGTGGTAGTGGSAGGNGSDGWQLAIERYNWLLERDINPASNDNTPAFLAKIA